MKKNERHPIHLKDYKPPFFRVVKVELTVEIFNEETLVTSKMKIERIGEHSEPLYLNGEKLELISLSLNDHMLLENEYKLTETSLIIPINESHFTVETKVKIKPSENTELEGLYKSGDIYCTQNEPEGFRKITYFIDRPDNMSSFTTTIIADKTQHPVLLSNGNCIEKKELENNRHLAKWEDPFLKPSYLFALVAGDLGHIHDTYTTGSGRIIDLYIYTEKGEESRCEYAMDCLKRSMKWDEDAFGLEYDLDIYMIVAVHSFNMGAMENKGLNIFNTSCVLADDKTATDDNFLRVETVICHEYFHNWTGNRVTLRDWFQLTLKEGLTVFRDQEFSSDMNSRAVKRIEDVIDLRTRQFPEDAGPNAHPIKPNTYLEINNFYTATIYDKGAEVIRMIHTLLGKEGFRKGIDTYFKLYDGHAITTEDFIHAMELGSGKDLTQFKEWYKQVGPVHVEVEFDYNSKEQQFTLNVQQSCPRSKKQPPLHFPLAVGLIGADGTELVSTTVLEVKEKKQSFTFQNIQSIPLPSLNRNFSAPIHLKANYQFEDLVFLMKHDTDLFNRYEAGQTLLRGQINENITKYSKGEDLDIPRSLIDCFQTILRDEKLEGMFVNKTLKLPSVSDIAEMQEIIDYRAIFEVREKMIETFAIELKSDLISLYEKASALTPSINSRKLKSLCLQYLSYTKDPSIPELIYTQYERAQNMTDGFSALSILTNLDSDYRSQALEDFYSKWKSDQLVITKWFMLQAMSKLPGTLLEVKKLMNDPVYDNKIPNLVRALLGGFLENHVQFHDESGDGYAFIADQILVLDELNPLVAARLVKGFEKYEKLDKKRKKLIKVELKRILEKPSLSPNVYELGSNILG